MAESPKVTLQEFDGSRVNPKIGASITFFAGFFEKGPINKPILITSSLQFKQIFGRALKNNLNDWYQVYNYLQYPYNPSIIVMRASGENSTNATASKPFNPGITKISGLEDFEVKEQEFLEADNFIKVSARSPGEWGNLLEVAVYTAKEYNENKEIKQGFFAKNLTGYIRDGYYAVIVFRRDLAVEKFIIKYDDIETINRTSSYIFLKQRFLDYKIYDGNLFYVDGDKLLADGNLPHNLKPVFFGSGRLFLSGGYSEEPTKEDIDECYDYVYNREEYQIDFIIANERYPEAAIRLGNKRKDCIVIVGTPDLSTETAIKKYSERVRSDYTYLVANYKKQKDNFSQKTFFCNFAGDIAGLRARLVETEGITESHCKFVYNLLNVEDTKYKFSNSFLDEIYQYNINSVILYKGLVNINSERLLTETFARDFTTRLVMNILERKCEYIARYFVFEYNDYFTREAIKSNFRVVLSDFLASGAIEDYKIICDITNNPLEIIDQKKIICDVYIKPKFLTEVVNLRFTSI